MRVLIDECIVDDFGTRFPASTQTARYAGLAGLKNGELLSAAEAARFDVFVTVDQGIEYQQNLRDRSIAIVVLRAKSNRLADLLEHLPAFLAVIRNMQPGQIVRIEP
jgi:hypothetical protein